MQMEVVKMGRGSGSGGGGGSFSGGSSSSGGSFSGSSGSRRSSSSSRSSGNGINVNHYYRMYNNVRRSINHYGGYGTGRRRSTYSRGPHDFDPYTGGNNLGGSFAAAGYENYSGSGRSSLVSWFIVLCIVWVSSLVMWLGVRGNAVTPLDKAHINIENTSNMIVDDLGWVTEDRGSSGTKAVMKAIDKFTSATGVQPLVLITDGINGAKFGDGGGIWEPALIDYYESTFSDDGHSIICLATRNGSDDYSLWIYNGAAASSVIGTEQQDVIFETFRKEWMDLNQDECDMIADTLTVAAKKFKGGFNWQTGLFAGSTVILVLFVGYGVFKMVSDRRLREEAERNRHSEAVDDIYDQMTGQN